jgi:2,5-diketo-D-gluconate reductase A
METVKLSNGVEMPILGLGVYQMSKEECENSVCEAIRLGYRSIDTASAYCNEEAVGRSTIFDHRDPACVKMICEAQFDY